MFVYNEHMFIFLCNNFVEFIIFVQRLVWKREKKKNLIRYNPAVRSMFIKKKKNAFQIFNTINLIYWLLQNADVT